MSNRDTGKTTKQIMDCPIGATFLWLNENLDYPRDLAKSINRDDIVIVSPGFFSGGRWRSRRISDIVVDHAAWPRLHERQLGELRAAMRNSERYKND